jgi:hypothetical protein
LLLFLSYSCFNDLSPYASSAIFFIYLSISKFF